MPLDEAVTIRRLLIEEVLEIFSNHESMDDVPASYESEIAENIIESLIQNRWITQAPEEGN